MSCRTDPFSAKSGPKPVESSVFVAKELLRNLFLLDTRLSFLLLGWPNLVCAIKRHLEAEL